jgi:hypothetical protein
VSVSVRQKKEHDLYLSAPRAKKLVNSCLYRLISPRAVRPPPAWFLIESFLVTLHTIPTEKVQPIVTGDELNHMIRFPIAPFAATNSCLL